MNSVVASRRVDQSIGKMKPVHEAVVGGFEAKGLINRYDSRLAQDRNSFKRLLFAFCPFDPLVDLIDDNNGCEYLIRML